MSISFWNFPKSCKYDVLTEERHVHLIHGALCDSNTSIEKVNRDFLAYGDEEALLIKEPKSPPLRLALQLYTALVFLLGSYEIHR